MMYPCFIFLSESLNFLLILIERELLRLETHVNHDEVEQLALLEDLFKTRYQLLERLVAAFNDANQDLVDAALHEVVESVLHHVVEQSSEPLGGEEGAFLVEVDLETELNDLEQLDLAGAEGLLLLPEGRGEELPL